MRRTAGALVFLAALSGCTATLQEPDACKKVCVDGRQQVPKPSEPRWTPNQKASVYANAPIATYTRIGPSGANPADMPVRSALASNQNTPTTGQTPEAPPAMGADQGSNFPRAPRPAPLFADKTSSAKPQERTLIVNDQVPPADPAALRSRVAVTGPRHDAKTPEIFGSGVALESSPLEKAKDVAPATTLKARPMETLVTSGYLPGRSPDLVEARPASPALRVINSKRITLNYKVNDVGPSGVSGIDVWFTHDGRAWKKIDAGTQTHPPCIVEVGDEGLYGFTLVARNGLGLGKAPPQAGDIPQVWVEVDLSKPVVNLIGVEPGANGKANNVLIRWKTMDKNLGSRPITISYAQNVSGPWIPIAANLENSEQYVWEMPANSPPRFLVRVEATDLAGNVGAAQSQSSVLIDTAQPTISILTVEAGK